MLFTVVHSPILKTGGCEGHSRWILIGFPENWIKIVSVLFLWCILHNFHILFMFTFMSHMAIIFSICHWRYMLWIIYTVYIYIFEVATSAHSTTLRLWNMTKNVQYISWKESNVVLIMMKIDTTCNWYTSN